MYFLLSMPAAPTIALATGFVSPAHVSAIAVMAAPHVTNSYATLPIAVVMESVSMVLASVTRAGRGKVANPRSVKHACMARVWAPTTAGAWKDGKGLNAICLLSYVATTVGSTIQRSNGTPNAIAGRQGAPITLHVTDTKTKSWSSGGYKEAYRMATARTQCNASCPQTLGCTHEYASTITAIASEG